MCAAKSNRTVIGEDCILRSAIPVDFEDVPDIKVSFGKFLLEQAEKKLEEKGNCVLLRNGALVLQDLDHDDISYQQIDLETFVKKSKLLSRTFFSLGLQDGDYFAMYLPNTTEFQVCVMGALLCGATVSPGDYGLTETGMGHQLKEIRPKIVLCYEGNLEMVKSALATIGLTEHTKIVVLSLVNNWEHEPGNIYGYLSLLDKAKTMEDVPSEANDTFDLEKVPVLIWTSGTTGRPKAIQMWNRSCRWWIKVITIIAVPCHMEVMETTCFFHSGGFFTAFKGLFGDFTSTFVPLDYLEHPECAQRLLNIINKVKPVFLSGGLHHLLRIASASKSLSDDLDLTSVRVVTPLGVTFSVDTEEKLKQHFPNLMEVSNWYGMSEFVNPIAKSSCAKNIGYVHPGTEVKIADPESEDPLKPNKVGEIMARFPYVMKGYLNGPEENVKFFGKDGFVHTGDLGYCDEDGVLYFVGRSKDLIKFQNFHVSPLEIEAELLKHPGVKEATVFGRQNKHDMEHPTAAVVKNDGFEVTEEDLVSLISEKLENSKQLRGGVIFVDSMPRNLQGKVVRKNLVELL